MVGVFESGGTSTESEVWCDVRQLASDAKRPVPYSGLRVRVADGADMDALARRIGDDPRYALEATPERDYYAKQAESSNVLYYIVVALAVLAGTGAAFGATNTLYAAVQARTAEIGTLRALGFSRGDDPRLLPDRVARGGAARLRAGRRLRLALLGRLISYLLGGVAFASQTFTTNVIQLRVGASDLAMALALSLFIGLVGGIFPALRASRLRPVEALRKA